MLQTEPGGLSESDDEQREAKSTQKNQTVAFHLLLFSPSSASAKYSFKYNQSKKKLLLLFSGWSFYKIDRRCVFGLWVLVIPA